MCIEFRFGFPINWVDVLIERIFLGYKVFGHVDLWHLKRAEMEKALCITVMSGITANAVCRNRINCIQKEVLNNIKAQRENIEEIIILTGMNGAKGRDR